MRFYALVYFILMLVGAQEKEREMGSLCKKAPGFPRAVPIPPIGSNDSIELALIGSLMAKIKIVARRYDG